MNDFVKSIIDQPIASYFDVIFITTCTIAIFYLRRVLDKFIFIPTAQFFKIKDKNGTKKFIENAWYCFYYPTVCYFGYKCLIGKPFFPWKHYNFFPRDVYGDWTNYPELKYYYLIQTSFYVQAAVSLIWELKRGDFLQYCIHHAATILLLVFSYIAGQHRMGCNVLILHDVSDILLYLTKICHYIDIYGGKKIFDLFGRIIFIIFAISFFVTRLYLYPIKVIWNATWTEDRWYHHASMYFMRRDPGINNQSLIVFNQDRLSFNDWSISPQYILLILMLVLVLLHMFWGFLILRMIFSFMFGSLKQDIRSEEEIESDIDYEGIDNKHESDHSSSHSTTEDNHKNNSKNNKKNKNKNNKNKNANNLKSDSNGINHKTNNSSKNLNKKKK